MKFCTLDEKLKPIIMALPRTVNRYHFTAEWGGNRQDFLEISGLNITIDIAATRNGDSKVNTEHKIPGITKLSDVFLKRNIIVGDNDFYKWIQTNNFGQVERREVRIKLLNQNHEPVMLWVLKNAFPSQYHGPVLLAGDSSLATETLVISYDELTSETLDGK